MEDPDADPEQGVPMIELEVYCVDISAHSLGLTENTMALTRCSLMGRTRLSGPFLNEPYPEYSAAYPLFPAENGALPREANTTPEDRKGTITDRLKRTAKTSGYGPKRSVSAQAQSRTLDWSGYYAKWVNGEDIPGSVGAIALRIGRGGDDANLLKTDSHVKREIARCGVVGDEDPWELRRSRTNTITRRLRLWVQWISLANCLEIVSKFHKESEEVISTPGTDPTSTFRDRREDGRRTLGEHDMGEHDVEVGNNRDELASSTADASDVQSNPTLQSPTSVKTKLTCKVTWFGKSVASFELCRRTGLPLTPGECLLALPRGVSWSSCNLRLELVAAVHVEKSKSRISRTRSVSEGSSSNCNSNSSDDSRSDDSGSDHSSQSKISSSVRSDADDHHSLDGTGDESNGSDGSSVLASAKYDEQRHGSETVLGSVMVDWKVLKSLKKHSYDFATCPAEVTPSSSGKDRYKHVECALCIPVYSSTPSYTRVGSTPTAPSSAEVPPRTSHRTPSSKTRANNAPRQNNPADAKNLIIPSRVAHSDDDGNDEKATAGCTVDKSFLQPNSPSVPSRAGETNHGGWYAPSPRDQRHTLVGWKVLPTRLAFSLRLERLHPVRPPYSLRAPQQAPPDCSMCRLRLAIAGLSVRASCASFPPSPRSDCSTSVATVWVRWNGHDDGIGKPSEWRMPLNEMEGTGKRDLLLPLPENNRERLRLSLRVAVPGFGNKNNKVTRVTDIDDQEQERSRTTGIVGTVDVGWDGLSCVPVYRTDYFVDACGGRSVLHPSLPVALELAAVPGSYGRFRAASSSPVRGLDVKLNLQLEVSPAWLPHLFQLSPAAVRGPPTQSHSAIFKAPLPSTTLTNTSASTTGLGDYRDPCRTERFPYLHFTWPWDNECEDSWAGSLHRRRSLVPHRPWYPNIHGSKRAVIRWRQHAASDQTKGHFALSPNTPVHMPLPLQMSGLQGIIASPGGRLLEISGQRVDSAAAKGTACRWPATPETRWDPGVYRSESIHSKSLPREGEGDVVIVKVFDMGPYAPLEHATARKIQRLWRRALEALRAARLWWEWEVGHWRRNAATRVQACYRGWKGRQWAKHVRRDGEARVASAVVIQRAWRCLRARARVQELRNAGLRRLFEEQRLERELAEKSEESRKAGLSVTVAQGAGLRGMDLSGVSDPFCVVLWNGQEVGRTGVRHGTRDPNWLIDEDNGGVTAYGDDAVAGNEFHLPFVVPLSEKWGSEAWPPMTLEVRCYDYDIMGPPDLIGRIEIGADSILGMVTVKGTSVVVRRAPTHTSAALTWLELEPGKENTGNSAVSPALSFNTASAGGLTEIIRNPFDSLGEIALAVTTTLPLPVSISEYNKWAAKDKADIDLGAQAAAEVGIRALLRSVQRAIASRDRGLWVVNASSLPKLDFFGKSDPYAKVFWDGREVGTTAICKNSLNPVWFNESAIGTRAQSEKSGNRHQPADDCNDTPYFWLESACSLNPRLRVEVYDWDAVGWHDFLGGVELDMDQMMNLQRTTLAKAKTTSSSNQQMLIKTDLPLRSRQNAQEGKSGTVGLCLYLDLEQEMRRRRRNQLAGARRQYAADAAEAEMCAMREGMERARMGDEDICVGVNGGDENRLALAQKDADAVQQQEQWQLFYDETSYDQPVPWWFNPVTGESAWECPTTTTTTTTQRIPAALTAFPSGHAAGVGGDSHDDQYFETEATTSTLSQEYGDSDTCPQHTSLVGANQTLQGGAWRSQQAEYSHDTSALAASTADVGARTEPGLALSVWTPYWSEEFQAYYYINEVTQESAWDLRPEAADSTVPTVPEAEGSDAERNEGETFQRQDGIMIETAPITRTGDEGAGEGVARGSGGNADARYGAEETQGAGGVAYESKLEQGVEDQAEQGLVLACPPGGVDRSSGYPYFVNERGNRVFCVQRRTA